MNLVKTLKALRLARQLEESGLVSLMMPPENFMASPKIDPRLMPAAEHAMAVYASICVWILRATFTAKLIALLALIGLLVKAWQ